MRELSVSEMEQVNGGDFSWEGLFGNMVGGAVAGAFAGSIAPGVGTAAGAGSGALLAGMGYIATELYLRSVADD